MTLCRPAHPSSICSHSQRAWLENGREDVHGWRIWYPAIKRAVPFAVNWRPTCVCTCVFAECFLLCMFSPLSSQSAASRSAVLPLALLFPRAFSFPPSVLTHDLSPLHAACNGELLSDVFLSWEAGLCQSTAHFSFNAAPLALPSGEKKRRANSSHSASLDADTYRTSLSKTGAQVTS